MIGVKWGSTEVGKTGGSQKSHDFKVETGASFDLYMMDTKFYVYEAALIPLNSF